MEPLTTISEYIEFNNDELKKIEYIKEVSARDELPEFGNFLFGAMNSFFFNVPGMFAQLISSIFGGLKKIPGAIDKAIHGVTTEDALKDVKFKELMSSELTKLDDEDILELKDVYASDEKTAKSLSQVFLSRKASKSIEESDEPESHIDDIEKIEEIFERLDNLSKLDKLAKIEKTVNSIQTKLG
jgi:hypothetical protein